MQLFLLITLTTVAFVRTARVRIIEGTMAELHEFPYQISLQWNFNNGSRPKHFCSGSILNRKWILTAAHCKDTLAQTGWMEVVAGVNNIAAEEDTAQRRNVSQFIQHENYHVASIKNDIGVILLSQPLELNSNSVSTITLARRNAIINETHGKLAGWGSISKTYTDIFPDELMKVTLPLRTLEDCHLMGSVDRSQVCGGGYRNVSACTADSGGPLTVEQDDGGRRIQIGVLSYGQKPCTATAPVVFSSVMYFHDWIQQTITRKQLRWKHPSL